MKILVSVKRVVDYNVRVQVKSDHSGVQTDNVKMSMNPFDEIAVEEAIKLKEAGKASEVVVCAMGVEKSEDVLRTAMAMGADRAILVTTDQVIQPLAASSILQKIIEAESPDLVLLGKQAIDDDSNQTGQMLAGLLGWPQATFASKIDIADKKATVAREVDGGTQVISCDLPCVVTVDLRLNEPRYPALPNIMKARSKPLDKKTPADYGVDIAPRLSVLKVEEPPVRSGGVKVENVDALIAALKTKGVL